MMATGVYERLALFLDDLPAGFPATDSGVELRILRRLFTPEEAELALHLTLLAEPARVIARRAKIPVEEATQRLQEMERKGLIFVYHRDGREPEYMATHFAVGIYEFQVNRLDPELVDDLEEFKPAWFDQSGWDRAPQLRTVPVGESIDAQVEVMSYERAEALVRGQKRFAVGPCICRQEAQIAGNGCNMPLETCLIMGSAATYYVHNGMGRTIDLAEALAILARAEEVGLVLQPSNAKKAMNICTCCGCCCGILTNVKRHPKPASLVASPFVAALDVDLCEGCGVCETRCQMEAVCLADDRLAGEHAVLDPDRCIGCGLCITTCPTGALSLVRKPQAEQPYVPRDLVDQNIKLAQARSKLTTAGMVSMLVRSRMDRLLAPKP
ncbi:MAG: 4Fe-4S dicluster domain-containing protein [Anaerolineae bacterium]|jgi:NAD-dependent dihydropyrimidine dehydrogenase PreA subunit